MDENDEFDPFLYVETKDKLVDCPPGNVDGKDLWACLYMAVHFLEEKKRIQDINVDILAKSTPLLILANSVTKVESELTVYDVAAYF